MGDGIDVNDAHALPRHDAHARDGDPRHDRRPVRALVHRGWRPRMVDALDRARRAPAGDGGQHAGGSDRERRRRHRPTPHLPRSARGDPEQLKRVPFNPIRDATHHAPADGSVTVRAEPTASRSRTRRPDTGDGIVVRARFQVRVRRCLARARRRRLATASSRAIVEGHGWRHLARGQRCRTRVRFVIPTGASR
jgi:signal transduction histidine kinase